MITLLLLALPSCWSVSAEQVPMFKDGDRVCFVGDSITHRGAYHAFIYLYYLTRFPDREIKVFNAGISGDTATGTLGRFEKDIAIHKPTVSTVMLGMNDIGRQFYKDDSPQNLEGREASLAKYRESMNTLVDRLVAIDSEVVFIGPSIYDQTAQVERKADMGINEALIRCSEFCQQKAKEVGKGFVDFNQPMLDINAKLQKEDPSKTIVSYDRVHPGQMGHLLMAMEFLKAQGVPGLVSNIEIDASNGRLQKQQNITVTSLEASDIRIRFDALATSLPFPWSFKLREARQILSFDESLNREVLKVTGLKPGQYRLNIGDKTVGTFSHQELGEGLHLGFNKSTPQNAQAGRVWGHMDEIYKNQDGLRQIRLKSGILHGYPGDPNNLEDIRSFLAGKLEETGPKRKRYVERAMNEFLSLKEREADFLNNVKTFEEKVYQENQPVSLTYSLERM